LQVKGVFLIKAFGLVGCFILFGNCNLPSENWAYILT